MDFIDSDRTLKVGDLVFSGYHKGELVFRIIKIERRFLTQSDLIYTCWEKGSVGDEYDPLATIESVANFSLFTNTKKKFRKTTKVLDATYLRRANPDQILEHIKRLNNLVSELWP